MDFSDVLVIELVPLAVDDVLAVGDVVPTCNRTHSAAGIGSAERGRPGIMSAAQTGLAAGKERREPKKTPTHNSCSGKICRSWEPGTATLCLPWKGLLSETEHQERV